MSCFCLALTGTAPGVVAQRGETTQNIVSTIKDGESKNSRAQEAALEGSLPPV